jgi:hypothetical protein
VADANRQRAVSRVAKAVQKTFSTQILSVSAE